MRAALTVFAVLLGLVPGLVGAATVNTFTSEAAFQAAIAQGGGSVQLETFDDVTDSVSFAETSVTQGDLTFFIDQAAFAGFNTLGPTASGFAFVNGTGQVTAGILVGSTLSISFAGAVTAFFADFSSLNSLAVPGTPQTQIELILADGTTEIVEVPVAGSSFDDTSFGFTTDIEISVLNFVTVLTSDLFGFDNVLFGIAEIPVPASLLLILSGLSALAGLGAWRRQGGRV